jgi:long-subunit fatty acid transport protein
MRNLRWKIANATALSLCLSASAHAAWIVDPTLRLQGRYGDNMTLSATDKDSGLSVDATAQARVRRVTERSSIAAAAGVTLESNSGVDSLDDEHREVFDLIAERSGERVTLRFVSSARFDSLLRSGQYIDEPFETFAGDGTIDDVDSDLDDLVSAPDTEIGSVTEQIDRTRINLQPSLSYALSERTQSSVSVGYSSQNYKIEDSFSAVDDSETYSVSLGLERQFSERTSVEFMVSAARNDADRNLDSDFYNAAIGVSRRFSERLRVAVKIGANRVEDDLRKDNGLLFDFQTDLRTQTGNLRLSASRSLIPGWYGKVDQTDQAAIGYTRRISNRVSFMLRASANFRDTGNAAGPGADRDYIGASTGIDWRLSEKWSIGGRYLYQWVDRKGGSDTASGNSVSLSLAYRPPRRL